MNRRIPQPLTVQIADELHELFRIFSIDLQLWAMRTRTRIELFYYNLRNSMNGIGDVSDTDTAFLVAALMITLMFYFAFLR